MPSSAPLARLRDTWRNGGPGLIVRRGRQVLLRKLHEGLLERLMSGGEQRATRGAESLAHLSITSTNKLAGSFYDPTPRLVIRWILRAITPDPDGWNFIDIGTGRGRVILEAARYPFRRVIGVEFASELFEAAEENVAAMPLEDIRAGRVGVAHGDATEWVLPDGKTVFFLYNPFDARVLRRFLDHVLDDHARVPRPMVFLYLNPEDAVVFEDEPRLVRTRLPDGLAMRMSMLSPYSLAIYETLDTA